MKNETNRDKQIDGICPYCHEDAEGYSTQFGAFWIRYSFHEGWLLHAGKCKPRPINHCPMCGRRLEKYEPRRKTD